MSHLGRPDGAFDPEGSLKPCAVRLGELLGKPVKLGPKEVIGPAAEALVASLKPGEVALLENVPLQRGRDHA